MCIYEWYTSNSWVVVADLFEIWCPTVMFLNIVWTLSVCPWPCSSFLYFLVFLSDTFFGRAVDVVILSEINIDSYKLLKRIEKHVRNSLCLVGSCMDQTLVAVKISWLILDLWQAIHVSVPKTVVGASNSERRTIRVRQDKTYKEWNVDMKHLTQCEVPVL